MHGLHRMSDYLRAKIGGSGLLFGRKDAKMVVATIDGNLCLPPIPVSAHAKQFRGVVYAAGSKVLQVLGVGDIAQIFYPVVRSIAVDVINEVFRPTSVIVEPRNAMRPIPNTVYPDQKVSIMIYTARGFAALCGLVAPANAPCKDPRSRIVVEKFAHTLRGKIGLSHDAPRMLIGQRPARVGSACGPRYFSSMVPA